MVTEGHKECPHCAEEIKIKARKCRFCGEDVSWTVPGSGLPKPAGYENYEIPEETAQAEPSSTGGQTAVAPRPPGPTPSAVPSEFRPQPQTTSPIAVADAQQQQQDQLKGTIPPRLWTALEGGLRGISEGERRNITVLFADLSGYTALSETRDPEEMKEIVDRCYAIMGDAVSAYDGKMDKFIGDCVMALFGAPIAHEDDPERAVRCSRQIREKIQELGKELEVSLNISVGINCGEVVVGAFGTESKLDYTAIGDTVNLASRLQGKAGSGEIFIGEQVFRRVRNVFDCEFVGALDIKGKRDKINCYRFNADREKSDKAGLRERIHVTPLVGREGELEKFTSAFDSADGGEGKVVILSGEAGVGKSRLTFELFKARESRDKNWLLGRFLSYGQNIPYLPFIEIIKKLAGIEDTESREEARNRLRAACEEAVPGDKATGDALEFLLALNPVSSPLLLIEAKDRKKKIFDAVSNLFRGLAAHKPLVLVIEDLHWSDPISLDLLHHIIPQIANQRVLLVLNHRPYFFHQWPAGVAYVEINLKELSAAESALLLRQLLNIEGLDPEFEKRLLRKAEGNPFYVEELVLSLRDQGLLEWDEATGKWRITKPVDQVHIPDTVQGLVLARIDRLEGTLRGILQCASVIGMGFRYVILEKLIAIEEELTTYLTRLVDMEHLFERSRIPELLYLFKHVVTREVTYNTLLRRRRQFFHGKIGEILEEIYFGRLDEHYEIIAHHYYSSDNAKKAIEYLDKAGEKSKLLFANEAAIDFYQKLIETIDGLKQKTQEHQVLKIKTHINLGIVKKLVGDYNGSIAAYEAAMKLAAEFDVSDLRAVSNRNIADVLRFRGEHDRALKHLETACSIWQETGNTAEEATCYNSIGVVYKSQGRYSEAIEQFRKADEIAARIGEIETRANALNNMANCFYALGSYQEALEVYHSALEVKRESLDKPGMVAILNNMGIIYERQCNFEKALKVYSESLKIAYEIGFKRAQLVNHL
ncbi:MAG: tetratricopeptide repeat protein, partial [bacterium]